MIGMAKRAARLAVVAALISAAVCATVGQASAAGVRPDDRSGIRGAGVGVQAVPPHALRPDDRPGVRGLVNQSRVLRVTAPLARTSNSFHWDDALIGAGVASAVAVLLVLSGLGLRRHVRLTQQPQLPASVERSLS